MIKDERDSGLMVTIAINDPSLDPEEKNGTERRQWDGKKRKGISRASSNFILDYMLNNSRVFLSVITESSLQDNVFGSIG